MLAVSTICYLHGKILGLEQATQVLQAQVMGKEVRGAPKPKAIDTIQRLGDLFGDLEELQIRIDPNGSNLGKARARALGWAHKTGASVWVACDDDVTASPGTLQTLVRLCREAEGPRVIVVPCALRTDGVMKAAVNVWPEGEAKYPKAAGALVLPLKYGGWGLVACNRAALEAICKGRPTWKDDDGSPQPLVFNCEIVPTPEPREHRWLGEDFAFFDQVRPFVPDLLMLTRGESDHAGAVIDLADVAALFTE
jgi:hypothetical protein